MKQHITTDQFLELESILNPDLEEPNKFWRYKLEDYGIDVDNCGDEFIAEEFTIGKMIQILSRKHYFACGKYMNNSCEDLYGVIITEEKIFDEHEELCDALWEAIKYFLKEGEL